MQSLTSSVHKPKVATAFQASRQNAARFQRPHAPVAAAGWSPSHKSSARVNGAIRQSRTRLGSLDLREEKAWSSVPSICLEDPSQEMCWVMPTTYVDDASNSDVHSLASKIEEVVSNASSDDSVMKSVNELLEDYTLYNKLRLPTALTKEAKVVDGSSRWELYTDPENRFTIAAVFWQNHQNTPVHSYADSEGMWLCEAVCSGEVQVEQFSEVAPGYMGKAIGDFLKYGDTARTVRMEQRGKHNFGRRPCHATNLLPATPSGQYQRISVGEQSMEAITLHVYGPSVQRQSKSDFEATVNVFYNSEGEEVEHGYVLRSSKAKQFRAATFTSAAKLADLPVPPVWVA